MVGSDSGFQRTVQWSFNLLFFSLILFSLCVYIVPTSSAEIAIYQVYKFIWFLRCECQCVASYQNVQTFHQFSAFHGTAHRVEALRITGMTWNPPEMLHQKRKKLIWRNFQLLLSQRKNPPSLVSCACDSGYCESEFQHIPVKGHKRLVWKSKIRFLISIFVFGLLPDWYIAFGKFGTSHQGKRSQFIRSLIINWPKKAKRPRK